jgi:HSP20 family molecular chaperone IbpA
MTSMLDFDPFEELLWRPPHRNTMWPEMLQHAMRPTCTHEVMRTPQKFRIAISCVDFNPSSIKVQINNVKGQHNLIVSSREQSGRQGDLTFATKEFKRSYALPQHVLLDKMRTYMTPYGQFVIEFPLVERNLAGGTQGVNLVPKKIKTDQGHIVSLKVPIPENVDPANVQVTVSDNDIVVRFEEKVVASGARSFTYSRATLPKNTDFKTIKCVQDKHKLSITAQLQQETKSTDRNIPIQRKMRTRGKQVSTSEESGDVQGVGGSGSGGEQQQIPIDKTSLTTSEKPQQGKSKKSQQKTESQSQQQQQQQQPSSQQQTGVKSKQQEQKKSGADMLKDVVFGTAESESSQQQSSKNEKQQRNIFENEPEQIAGLGSSSSQKQQSSHILQPSQASSSLGQSGSGANLMPSSLSSGSTSSEQQQQGSTQNQNF